MPPEDLPSLDFKSPEDLDQILRLLSRRLHYINRVSGESHYMWTLAELLAATGDLARAINDREVTAPFGNGYAPGELDQAGRRDLMLALLSDRMPG
ncbi:hypothetical protein ATO6_00005 [Oceanicola sp. 22II-s10i]|uniref:hypothetical protein n=1 Tax=Oceanicola sp. 22II-s10i TaxID=1317116 RepID=UPI000B524084|nr:hypothetical protein [Oceanicola sp. 22II-s10i]OWU85385.1 hypothetical protein ATO6_00005 [Oceanicola sp. 22II-s10i]